MLKSYQVILLALFFLLQVSCGRRNSAGFGGNAKLTFKAYHHSLPIDSFKVYLKFNTLDAPTDNEYDTQQEAVLVNGDGEAVISGLKKGDYYVFAKGWDPTIQQIVKGGMPYSLSREKDQNVDVAVTED